MNDDDPINVEYSGIIEAMGEDVLADFEQAEFDAVADMIAGQFTKAADYYAGVFDPYVVAGALHKVWQDYNAHVMGDGDDE